MWFNGFHFSLDWREGIVFLSLRRKLEKVEKKRNNCCCCILHKNTIPKFPRFWISTIETVLNGDKTFYKFETIWKWRDYKVSGFPNSQMFLSWLIYLDKKKYFWAKKNIFQQNINFDFQILRISSCTGAIKKYFMIPFHFLKGVFFLLIIFAIKVSSPSAFSLKNKIKLAIFNFNQNCNYKRLETRHNTCNLFRNLPLLIVGFFLHLRKIV